MKRILLGFVYATRGVVSGFRSERNMKLHALAAVIVIALGFYLHVSPAEWIVLLLCIGGVVSSELINTALEQAVNLISPGQNPKAGTIKDLAAGAVLIIAMVSAAIGCIVFIPKLL